MNSIAQGITMFKKICFSPEENIVATHKKQEIFANPKLVNRLTKLADSIKAIAPRSDDFLYFSIIFLKSAESALLNEDGSIKKIANNEDAWGFFDEEWKWHGNVSPHRNNNKDIFPESELKKAASKWVGLPLCRDHESSSVDGIRGIILDTHYDEKYKQVVGLCALDKVNYPDLARKVETRLVRYGSMGTAVETSICSECGNRATTQKEYCNHILNKTAHGEINVGLKPIEYSLVVQPAEPGAILLKCIASLQEYKDEFMNYGVDDVGSMLGRLNLKQAEHLEGIMKTACGNGGCSVEKRTNIVRSFLENNGLMKNAERGFTGTSEDARNKGEVLNAVTNATEALKDPNVSSDIKDIMMNLIRNLEPETITRPDTSREPTERLTSHQNIEGRESELPGNVQEFSAASSRVGAQGGGDTGNKPDFSPDDDVLSFPSGGEPLTGFAGKNNRNIKVANKSDDNNDFIDDFSINSIVEDIVNESRLRKRAELRRRIAYAQGGAEGVEPNTYKSEPFDKGKDKQMHQDKGMGGNKGMVPGDAEVKGKLSRAQLNERRLRRLAYMQGGAEGAEPNTYKSESFDSGKDKQMHQDKGMGGDSGMFPGDAEAKGHLQRASEEGSRLRKNAYRGPSLSTRFSVRRRANGSVDHHNSLFEVYSGKKRVIASTAGEIFGPELSGNWEWIKSRDYGKEVCEQIRSLGLNHVSGLLKTAQEAPAPEAELPPLPPMEGEAAPAEELPPLDDALPALEKGFEGEGEEELEDEGPAEAIDNRLSEIEQLIDEIRDAVGQLEDERLADVDVNVFTGKDKGGEEISAEEGGLETLSGQVVNNLKTAYRKLDDAADELSMVAETYDNLSKLSSAQRGEFVKLASSAVQDADQITGEAKVLVRLANTISLENASEDAASNSVEDSAYDAVINHVEDPVEDSVADSDADDAVSELVTEAMNLRRARRNAILKQAEDRVLTSRAQAREALLKSAECTSDFMTKDYADEAFDEAPDEVADEAFDEAPDEVADEAFDGIPMSTVASNNALKETLNSRMISKQAEEEREGYRVKLRRAYDVGLEMQRKGLLTTTKTALDKQVDEIMTFDDNAFEAFKRSIGNARPIRNVKIASDLGGVNIGVESDSGSSLPSRPTLMNADTLSSMWDE